MLTILKRCFTAPTVWLTGTSLVLRLIGLFIENAMLGPILSLIYLHTITKGQAVLNLSILSWTKIPIAVIVSGMISTLVQNNIIIWELEGRFRIFKIKLNLQKCSQLEIKICINISNYNNNWFDYGALADFSIECVML